MAKLTKLQPVLVERTCDYCENGILKLKEQCSDNKLFKTRYWYEYECKKCGHIIKTEHPLQLREIIYVNPETRESYKTFLNRGILIDF